MTVTPKISVNDGNLVVHGKTILSGVHDNIVLTPGSGVGLVAGAFIGATASHSKSLHVFPVGVLEGVRFMCLFRFKLWWMTQRMGTCGRDIPLETQFMLVESKDSSESEHEDSPTIYTVFLPLLEGQFRAVLQGNEKNELEICLESGDNAVETNQGLYLVYMHAGTNPFEVINQAVKAVEKHLQTFQHREKKKLPSFIDWFGWCTWDAFYTDVTAEGVEEGLKSLSEGGTPPRFLIIDDGWQQIGSEVKEDPNCVVQEGAQFANRLTGIKENEKFQKNGKADEHESGLKLVVKKAKQQHNVNLLKIWNVNKCSGVVGVFNCQGAGWCKVAKKTRIHDASPGTLTGSVQATDVDSIAQIAGPDWTGDTIVYAHRSREVVRLPKGVSLPVTLKVLEYELFHFCPVKNVTETISFASIGLLDMFNSTGAVEQLEVQKNLECLDSNSGSEALSGDRFPVATITLKVRGCGRFGVYCSQRPVKCTVDNTETEFNYDDATGLVTLTIPVPVEEMYKWSIEIQV
ncbi:UNVERIFIED_CONTAM: putative galactinol--sucrose galactosyltransferase 2 [Sesamum radiatum]|uniref:galactinol--sucrose galactosyltransferase n=1 Tax=Sesamum radiatum TaxID=300843 RepID=A0AAW2NSK2_SESRA